MNQQKRIDKIIDAVEGRIQAEVGTLLGADFVIVGGKRQLVSKEEAFLSLAGKQICAQMDISGEITGKSCLLIGIKDAIRLGGTLIMLPAAELKEVVGREEYSDEIEDSYGEIANIIAGSFTKEFEESYPQSCRFVRKDQEILVPAKIDIAADTPIVDGIYYQIHSSMMLEGQQMGNLVQLLPATTFELQQEEKPEEPAGQSPVAETPEPETTAASLPKNAPVEPKFDAAKHQKKINRLLIECGKRIQSEVSGLLSADITLGEPENRLLGKEEFFEDHVTGRQVLADMEVAGETEGKSYFGMSVKDAIHLGGVLIMLPPAELENVVKAEDFGVDARDAYGEIANIISGVYTAVFEEQYSEKLRFIRKELRDIVPARVDVASDEPIPDKNYYTSSMSMAIGGKTLGKMHMLFPAEMLHLDAREDAADGLAEEPHKASLDDSQPSGAQPGNHSSAAGKSAESSSTGSTEQDVRKQQRKVDKVLASCRDRMANEVGALLGTEIKLSNLENYIISKEQFFFDEVSGKQVVAKMDVVGELTGKSYLSVGLRDAIRMGGTLIMLPSSELDAVAAAEDFSEDTQDAFSEIANIIAGAYTTGFEELYAKQVRFVKNGLQQVAPMKVDIAAAEPFADQDYYLSRMDLTMGSQGLGKIHLLFPVELLQLGELRAAENGAGDGQTPAPGAGTVVQSSSAQDPGQNSSKEESGPLDILVVGDDEMEAHKIAEVLRQSGYAIKILSFKDNLHNYLPGKLKAIYLVMREVNEQAFGIAIKVSSACSVPLIAAGPGWTRTTVIKAVKYGVRDILLTPAAEKDIRDNVTSNLLELAA